MGGGGKSVLYSGHNYGAGGSYQSIDAGVWLYGDIVDGFKISGDSSSTGLDCSEQVITFAEIHGGNDDIIHNVSADNWDFGDANLTTTGNPIAGLVDSITHGATDSVCIIWKHGKPDTLFDVR